METIITPATGINTDMSGSIGRGSTGVNDARPGNYEWDGEKLNEINEPDNHEANASQSKQL